ncbi:hypothetical protein KSC_002310 [Ktedonobacter sp. SOSP1-52]|uniref:DEAD/DEAH box helicase n=1 Tax=Ktedonobacter sp. SOSP1-52 TaxID=2778366 RepID=UPI001915330E|nr:DEAD/DEAH box helicase [Ktedonobacter sp. SOSP1-52]GHO61339.1 hypothetical protein KSC_002310 [Ktedonobacter sp. SOSP1-52]
MRDAEIQSHVLATLEKLEAQQINVGLYSTHVTPESVFSELNGSRDSERKSSSDELSNLSLEEVDEILRLLVIKGEVIEWRQNYFRSRVAEMVRLLRLLRQRFWKQEKRSDLFKDAPLLIEDIRVEFRKRVRPTRTVDLRGAIPPGLQFEDAFLHSAGFEKVSAFQAKSLNEIFSCAQQGNTSNQSFIVAGDTGAGKTEAFLFPILLDIAHEPESLRSRQGVRAVLVYPRIRLARNQLTRLLKYTTRFQEKDGPRITLGIQNSNVPDNAQKFKEEGWKSEKRGDQTFYRVELLEKCARCGKGKYWVNEEDPDIDRGCPTLQCDNGMCNHTIRSLYITHEALKKNAPHILIITDISLSQWLSREEYSHLWGLWVENPSQDNVGPTVPPRYLVLDEVHLYEQLRGAHISRLIKRFQARVRLVYKHTGEPQRYPLVIGVSATLQNEVAFLAKLLDIEDHNNTQLRCIKPQKGDTEDTDGRERYIFIYPRNLSPTPEKADFRVTDQTAAIQIVMAAIHNLMTKPDAVTLNPVSKQRKAWRGLAFFDSINDLRQFRYNYGSSSDPAPSYIPGISQQASANQDELWRIRTDRKKEGRHLEDLCGMGCDQRLKEATLHECPHFLDGDCWIFAKLHGCNQQLNVADPVYANATASLLDDKDLIPASPSLEVGYDDDAIQLVYQHKAPPNAASFIQRRGRAGRDPNDSPIIITLLWPYRHKDAFYFFHPEALYAPTFDDVPLNASNFNVQRTHILLAFFDLLACWRRQNINNVRGNPQIPNFTKAGKHYFRLGEDVVREKRWFAENTDNTTLILTLTQTREQLKFKRGQLKWIREEGNDIFMAGWLAMDKKLLPHVLKPAWNALNSQGDFNQYIEDTEIVSKNFLLDPTYNPFYLSPLSDEKSKLPVRLLNQFAKPNWHLSNDRERDNWIRTYKHVDWMLQENQEATTLTVHYPDPEKDPLEENDLLTVDVAFALTELLPGNVSYRLRERKAIHWTPVPLDGQSTFLYPQKEITESDNSDEENRKEDDETYLPDIQKDIATQPDSMFGVSQFIYERFRRLQFMTLKRLRVKSFSPPDKSHSPNWVFVPTKTNSDTREHTDGYALDINEPNTIKPKGSFPISRSSSARANSIIIPFAPTDPIREAASELNFSHPLNRVFSSILGFKRGGNALPGFYRVYYDMHIDIKGERREHVARIHRYFYPPERERDETSQLKPILVGYSVKTQAIYFYVNPDLLEETVNKVLEDTSLRLSMRRNFAIYCIAPKSAEWELFIQTQLDWTEVAVDYWLHEVAVLEGPPRLLDADLDLNPLVSYYRTHRIAREREVEHFQEFLERNTAFFSDLNSVLERAFHQKNQQEFRAFVTSVILHSFSTLLKNLVARLGGVDSDSLIAYADLPILELVDNTNIPRILIMDTVEGGAGGITQAFERLDVQDASETSLYWTLVTELGRCPIGEGEDLIRTALAKASIEQIIEVQRALTSGNLEETVQLFLKKLGFKYKPSKEATRMLGRMLFKRVDVADKQSVNPTLVLKELFTVQELLEMQVPGNVDRRATILHAVRYLDKATLPSIYQFYEALQIAGVAQNDLRHELALQLLGLYKHTCEDGCPVCLSASSDIEHIYLAPRLNSRRVLKKLREILFTSRSGGQSVIEIQEPLLEENLASIYADPGELGDHLNTSLGIGIVSNVNDEGYVEGTSVIVVNPEQTQAFFVTGDWEKHWKEKPFQTPLEVKIRSKVEYKIALMLEKENILYEHEPRIPYRTEENITSYIHPSFFLYEYNLYIEYWGREEAEYIESKTLKERVYANLKQHRNLQVLFLTAEDIEQDTFMSKIQERIKA